MLGCDLIEGSLEVTCPFCWSKTVFVGCSGSYPFRVPTLILSLLLHWQTAVCVQVLVHADCGRTCHSALLSKAACLEISQRKMNERLGMGCTQETISSPHQGKGTWFVQ
jgi:hypothetical protein